VSSINRQPTGWLGFLGIKNFGRNPEQVAGVLAPVWDYSEWYLQTAAQFTNTAGSFNAVGFFAEFQVPTNEVWTVHALSCLAGPLGGGETIRMHAAIADQASSVFTILPNTSDSRVATANDFGICAAQGSFILGPGEVAVVERLGAPQATLARPGLLVHAPPPIDRLRRLQVGAARRAPLLSGGALLLCGDQSLLALEASLHYEIEDPHAFLYGAVDAEAALVELGRAALVDTIARCSHEEVLTTGRAEIEAAVLADTDRAVRQVGLGLRVRGVQLGTTRIPAPALGAFLEVISAAEARLTEINEAQAFAARVLPAAGGEAVTRIAAAHGRAAEQVARARAQDALLRALSTGGAAAPALTRARLRAEGLEQAWGGKRLLVLPDTVTYEGLLPQDRGQTP
jgi:membrane protease subunit HflK